MMTLHKDLHKETVRVPGYVVRLTWTSAPRVHAVSFEVFEDQAIETDPPIFPIKGWVHCMQLTEDIDLAEVHVQGLLKWDGCFQFSVEGYVHLDEGREMEGWFEMIRATRRLAQAKITEKP